MKTYSYLLGGRLGDFLHGLIVPAYMYAANAIKSDIYISNIGDVFSSGIDRSYSELRPLLEKQLFFNSFKIYDGVSRVDCRICDFRFYPRLMEDCWTDIYLKHFLPGTTGYKKNFAWMVSEKRQDLSDCLLVSRKHRIKDSDNNYLGEIEKFDKSKVFFMCGDQSQYIDSGLQDRCQLLHLETLYDMSVAINSCKLFLGDQSMPLALASALCVPRIAELNRRSTFYAGEAQYCDNITWFSKGVTGF